MESCLVLTRSFLDGKLTEMVRLLFLSLFLYSYTGEAPITKQEPIPLQLKAIAIVESHSGQNTDHKLVTTGINKGSRAYGMFGLMPLTIIETVKKTKSLSEYYAITSVAPNDIHIYMENHPELQFKVAKEIYLRLFKRYRGNLSKISYSWLNGHIPSDLNDEDVKAHWYSRKVANAYNKLLKLQDNRKLPPKR